MSEPVFDVTKMPIMGRCFCHATEDAHHASALRWIQQEVAERDRKRMLGINPDAPSAPKDRGHRGKI